MTTPLAVCTHCGWNHDGLCVLTCAICLWDFQVDDAVAFTVVAITEFEGRKTISIKPAHYRCVNKIGE